MKKISLITTSVAVVTALSFMGCGGGTSSSPNTVTKSITGTISGNGYARNDIFNKFLNNIITPAYALDPTTDPDKIIVMYDSGYLKKEFTISPDGSFEIDTSLFEKNDLVILVVNSGTKKVFGHLSLGATSGEKLDFIDKSKLSSNLSLGSIDTENNCSTSVTIQGSGSFSSEDSTSLETVAKADNGLALYKNIYANSDFEELGFDSMFGGDAIKGVWTDVETVANEYYGLMPRFDVLLKGYDYNKSRLYPPSAVTYGTKNDSTTKNANETTPIANLFFSPDEDNPTVSAYVGFPFIEQFPNGDWLLKIDGNDTVMATFNFNAINALDDNNKSIVPIPSIKLNMDTNNASRITSIDLKWYMYDGTQYSEIEDDVLNSINTMNSEDIEDRGIISLRASDNAPWSEKIIFDNDTISGNFTPSNTNQDIVNDSLIYIAYQVGSIKYQFRFNLPDS